MPFTLTKQINDIQNIILDEQEKIKREELYANFDSFFYKDLFKLYNDSTTEEVVINDLCSLLKDKDYVDDTFMQKVYNREKAAGTAFGNIAIPHATDMDALKTSVAVAISPSGITWGENIVNVVLLLAINKADRHLFREVYESLISLFGDSYVLKQISQIKSFDDFRKLIRVPYLDIT